MRRLPRENNGVKNNGVRSCIDAFALRQDLTPDSL